MAYYMTPPLLFLIWLFSNLPFRLQLAIVRCYKFLGRFGSDENLPSAAVSFMNYHGIRNMLQITRDMIHIKGLDQEAVIADNTDKLIFYYGTRDPWVPTSFYDKMKERFPDCDVRLCDKKFEHAFVLYNAKDVGSLACTLIQDVLQGAC